MPKLKKTKNNQQRLYIIAGTAVLGGLALIILSFASTTTTTPQSVSGDRVLVKLYTNQGQQLMPGMSYPDVLLLHNGTLIYSDPCKNCKTTDKLLKTTKLTNSELSLAKSALAKAGLKDLKSQYLPQGFDNEFSSSGEVVYYNLDGNAKRSYALAHLTQEGSFLTVKQAILNLKTNKRGQTFVPHNMVIRAIEVSSSDSKNHLSKNPFSANELKSALNQGLIYRKDKVKNALNLFANEKYFTVSSNKKTYAFSWFAPMPGKILKTAVPAKKTSANSSIFYVVGQARAQSNERSYLRPVVFIPKDSPKKDNETLIQNAKDEVNTATREVKDWYFRETARDMNIKNAVYFVGEHDSSWYATHCPHFPCIRGWEEDDRFYRNVIDDFKRAYKESNGEWPDAQYPRDKFAIVAYDIACGQGNCGGAEQSDNWTVHLRLSKNWSNASTMGQHLGYSLGLNFTEDLPECHFFLQDGRNYEDPNLLTRDVDSLMSRSGAGFALPEKTLCDEEIRFIDGKSPHQWIFFPGAGRTDTRSPATPVRPTEISQTICTVTIGLGYTTDPETRARGYTVHKWETGRNWVVIDRIESRTWLTPTRTGETPLQYLHIFNRTYPQGTTLKFKVSATDPVLHYSSISPILEVNVPAVGGESVDCNTKIPRV